MAISWWAHGAAAPTWEDPTGVTDHGALTGLSDDDHAQYVFNAPGSSARNEVQPSAAGAIPLTLKGHASQSVNLQEWQDSAAGVLASLSQTGRFTAMGAAATPSRFVAAPRTSG